MARRDGRPDTDDRSDGPADIDADGVADAASDAHDLPPPRRRRQHGRPAGRVKPALAGARADEDGSATTAASPSSR